MRVRVQNAWGDTCENYKEILSPYNYEHFEESNDEEARDFITIDNLNDLMEIMAATGYDIVLRLKDQEMIVIIKDYYME